MINIFEIDDIRKYIFSFLRKEPKEICKNCKIVLIWDKDVRKNFNISIKKHENFELLNGYYCIECYYKEINKYMFFYF